jgi:hypothetical protein
MSDLYRVLSGEVSNQYLTVLPAELDALTKSEYLYSEVYNSSFEKGVYTIEELCEDISEKQDCIMKRLESLKVEYYKTIVGTYPDDPSRFFSLEAIEKTEEELSSLVIENRRLEYLSCEGIASFAKTCSILESTTVWRDSRKPYDWTKANISQVYDWFVSCKLLEKDIRDIAKSREWRQIWNIRTCGSIFSRPLFLLSDEQKDLLFWSSMYDSAAESEETPTEEVIKDDHAFDGWLIDRHRARSRETEQASRGKFSKAQQAQDVFLPANNAKDLDYIQKLNSPEAMGRKMTIFRKMNEDAKT